MTRRGWFGMVVLIAALWRVAPCQEPTAESDRLAALLDRMVSTARQYQGMALKFECQELIEFRSHDGGGRTTGREKFSYLYERDALGRFHDCRLRTKAPAEGEITECIDPAERKVPLFLSNAYLWSFAFRRDRQPLHDFRLVGDGNALDRPALVVDYAPRGLIRPRLNDWYARVWIDRETYQLLRVVAYEPIFWETKQRLEAVKDSTRAPREKDYEIETVTTEFGESQHGMRFASRVELRRSRFSWASDYREKKLLTVVQTYGNYRFYQVATEETLGDVGGSEQH